MYKKILVAYDGSTSSKNCLLQTIRLAETEKSWIKVVAVVPSYEGDLDMSAVKNIDSILKGQSEKLLIDAKDIAKSHNYPIMIDLEQGEAYEKIIDVADEENCDLIAMGRRGLRRLERAFMGSVTQRVIGHTKKDVFVVPRDTALGYGNILLTTDGSSFSEAAAQRAFKFAKDYSCKINILSVVDITDEFYAEAPGLIDKMVMRAKGFVSDIQKRAASMEIKSDTFVKEGEPYEKIADLATELKSGVIFMGSHGRKGIKKFFMGSVAEKVIGHAPCPVFVIKE